MSGGYDRSRAVRSHGRRTGKKREEGDAIAVALSVQILLCVLVLLGFGIVRRADPAAYRSVRGEFTALVGEGADDMLGDYLEELSGMGQGFFGTVEALVQRLFARAPAEAQGEPAAGTAQPPAASDAPAAESFGYRYLDDEDPLPAGAGGYNPVAGLRGAAGEYLPAPAGSTLAPVYLAGRIKPPLSGRVTSLFAYRLHPITGESDFHTGMDIAAAEGTAILAALPGEVVEVGESDIYGNYIILQHATNLQTFYAHCAEIIAAEGMAVRQGERIAKVGQTGVATGPHLHFSVIVDGLYTDPRHVLEDFLVVVEE